MQLEQKINQSGYVKTATTGLKNFYEKFNFTTICYRSSLNPNFVTGFIDAEGCFHVSIVDNINLKLGKSIRAIFQISLHKKDKALLEKINDFFGVGKVFARKDGAYYYNVTSVKDLLLIIEHLDKYPLITQKRADFELFKQVVYLMLEQEHLTESGLDKIANIKANMNFSINTTRLGVKNTKIYDLNWVSGFVEGEGCFFINIYKRKDSALGEGVKLVFKVTQDQIDREILENFIQIFSCGKVYNQSSKTKVQDFIVTGLRDVIENIIPFFLSHPLQGAKKKDFEDFVKVAELMKNKAHLNKNGLGQIRDIKSGMNLKRV